MHCLFVGYYVNDSIFNQILERKINNMSVARQKFEFNLIRGLYEKMGDNIHFVSYVPTDASLKIPESSLVAGARVHHIALQKGNVQSMLAARKSFEVYLKNLGEERLHGLRVIMYAVNPIFESVLLKYRKKYNFKIITICSEVPTLRRYGNSIPAKVKKHILTYYNEQFDGYIFFSEEMRNVVNYKGKSNIVLEGIAPDNFQKPVAGKKNVLMYAGGLAADNNVAFLLECCLDIPSVDEVWVCGDGPEREKILALAENDPRIKYFGRMENAEVLKLESQAKILVNFRSPDAELTKYSFPSKILEYIASGSLVLSTPLIGIPQEYFNYIEKADISDKNAAIATVERLLAMPDEEYIKKVSETQNFIASEKNYKKQCERIAELLENL